MGGWAASDNLIVESVCSRNLEDNVRTQWSCHGRWRTEDHRQMLVLSTPFFTSTSRAISEASASPNSCQLPGTASSYQSYQPGFNITSSGPCLQALTGASPSSLRGTPHFLGLIALILLIVIQA